MVLLAPSLAHAQGAMPSAAEPHITDPTGDAMWHTTSGATGAGTSTCWIAGKLSQNACSTANVSSTADQVPRQGLQAPAVLDLVSVSFSANATVLLVDMTIASLSADFATGAPEDEGLFYATCWGTNASCRDLVALNVWHVNGSQQFDPYYARFDGDCGKTTGCYFGIMPEIVPGTPGHVRWSVPRGLLARDEPDLVDPLAIISRSDAAGGFSPAYHLRAPQDAMRAGGSFSSTVYEVVDTSAKGKALILPPAASDAELRKAFTPTLPDAPNDGAGHRADLDILGSTLVESEKMLTVSTQVARVDEVPKDHHYYVVIGTTSGGNVVAGYDAAGGVRASYSGRCVEGCSPHPNAPLTKPAEVSISPGAPGWVNLTIARADLAEPGPGDTLGWLYVGLLVPQALVSQDPGAPAGSAHAENVDILRGDFVYESPPWFFTLGKERASDAPREGVLKFADRSGDAALPLDAMALTSNPDEFDITSLKVEAISPTEVRFELSLADLSTITKPRDYEAVFFAAAITTEQGAFMVGYYDNGDTKKQFLCAPDTDVFASTPIDPRSVVWASIPGIFSIVHDRAQGAGGSTPGSIVFVAPYSCFNAPPHTDLRVDAIGAGTFLVPQGGQVATVDVVKSNEAATILAARVVDTTPWYAAPFGIADFWNIAGVVVALIAALAGAIAVQRRRGALRRYLREIDAILETHRADGRAREAALLAVQTRLGKDLLRNRITESHFVIVERRLETSLGTTRTSALADAFGDVPHRLLVALQGLLADGVMDEEDWRLFRAQLAAEPHLTPETRAAIERRVEAWAAQRGNGA